jgi:MoxR-like ATPase
MEKHVKQIVKEVGRALIGKEEQIKLALCCLFAKGHLLIEDMPGMGKTTLAQALARAFALQYNRIQFTSDLLPADILGVSVFDRNSSQFQFHPGPVFTQILLADEINRTTPKTQSALLEAMAEGQVTVEGETRPLPDPFFVIATQNPLTQSGTFPLPESQLDRFLMRIELGYPDPKAELELFKGGDSRGMLETIKPCLSLAQLHEIQAAAEKIKTSDRLLDYLQRLIAYTRTAPEFEYGLSPRGALALLRSAKTWALICGRSHVIPEDIQAVLPSVAGHRLSAAVDFGGDGGSLVARMLSAVDVIG